MSASKSLWIVRSRWPSSFIPSFQPSAFPPRLLRSRNSGTRLGGHRALLSAGALGASWSALLVSLCEGASHSASALTGRSGLMSELVQES